MPSNLDDQLDYILKSNAAVQVGFDEFSLKDYDKLVPAIKQSFEDAGYQDGRHMRMAIADRGYMTGQEWYDRWNECVMEEVANVPADLDVTEFMDALGERFEAAAKRAAGLDKGE